MLPSQRPRRTLGGIKSWYSYIGQLGPDDRPSQVLMTLWQLINLKSAILAN